MSDRCGMVAYLGDSRDELFTLVERLENSAERDSVGIRLGMSKTTHPDGWGFVVLSDSGCQLETFATAIFEDDAVSHVPDTQGRILAVFHARRATKGVVEQGSSQPFFGKNEGRTMYLAHNGSLDMDRLKSELSVDGVTDSQMVLRYSLAVGLPAATSRLTTYVDSNSALNLVVLDEHSGSASEIFVNSYYKRNPEKRNLTEYYAMMFEQLPHGRAAFSSTLNDYGCRGRPLPPGLVRMSDLN